jgi:DNA-directed RNA polymerase subunit RPC12/RpoP
MQLNDELGKQVAVECPLCEESAIYTLYNCVTGDIIFDYAGEQITNCPCCGNKYLLYPRYITNI